MRGLTFEHSDPRSMEGEELQSMLNSLKPTASGCRGTGSAASEHVKMLWRPELMPAKDVVRDERRITSL